MSLVTGGSWPVASLGTSHRERPLKDLRADGQWLRSVSATNSPLGHEETLATGGFRAYHKETRLPEPSAEVVATAFVCGLLHALAARQQRDVGWAMLSRSQWTV
jgi:hypothetical protein